MANASPSSASCPRSKVHWQGPQEPSKGTRPPGIDLRGRRHDVTFKVKDYGLQGPGRYTTNADQEAPLSDMPP
jgi:hypothetical protein